MFWTWFGLAAAAFLRPISRAWTETLAIAAIAFLALPLINALTTRRDLVTSLANGDGLFVAFDFAMLATSALLGFAAWRTATKAPRPSRQGNRKAPAPSGAPQLTEAVDAM